MVADSHCHLCFTTLLAALATVSIIKTPTAPTPCLEPLQLQLQLSTGLASIQQQINLGPLVESACNLTATLDLPSSVAVAGAVHACHAHTCAALSTIGYTPTLNGKPAR